MNILVITGSAHKNGTSAKMAEEFIKGAQEAGNDVYRFDAAFKNVHPCLACEKCHNTDKGCVFKDDMEEINPHLLDADLVVFVSPVYYYGITAQIKSVIDRFYANDSLLHGHKKAVLLLTMEEKALEAADGCISTFKDMTRFLNWEIFGTIVAADSVNLDALMKTDYPAKAYALGKSI